MGRAYFARLATDRNTLNVFCLFLVIHSMGVSTLIRLLLAMLLLAQGVASAQDLEAQARALRPADPSELSKAADDDLERRAHEALDGIRRAYRRKDIDEQRPVLRRRLEESLGIQRLPWPPDLQTALTGQMEREGYRIDKLVFQTLPGVWVPAHLYLPSAMPKPVPAVLLASAHAWDAGKAHPDAQAFAINMARMGFAVLVYDAMGQGERAGSPADHRRSELRLVGVTQQALVQYEIRCALDYLRSRLEVDPERIGMAGADGGGFATWIATALDEAVRAVVVMDDTTDFHEQIRYLRSLDDYELDDHCALIPGIYRYANQHELLGLVAPRPVLIVQPTADAEFPIGGARTVYEYGTEIYTALQDRKGIAFVEDESNGRGFQKAKREAAYGWFLERLASSGNGRAVKEPDTKVEAADSSELAALPEGRTAPPEPGITALVTSLAATVGEQSSGFRPDALLDKEPPRTGWGVGLNAALVTRHLVTTQPRIVIPWLAWRPGPKGLSPDNGVLVAVDDRGKEELISDPIIREAVEKRGWMVMALDPRGIGEMRSPKPDWFFRTTLLLGEDLLWRQAFDIRRFVEGANNSPSHIVGLYARGPNASLAAAYALATARPQPEFAVFRDGFLSFHEVWQRRRSAKSSSESTGAPPNSSMWGDETPEHWFALNVFEAGDIPAFFKARRGREFIIDPLNPQPPPAASEDAGSSPYQFISLEKFLFADWE
ncbi:MAG TPA: CocE/NonD family hydrolase [Bryobacterales bacterium]|nr:CocE/NonD family hydrolase [Bryobacterales bacterium]